MNLHFSQHHNPHTSKNPNQTSHNFFTMLLFTLLNIFLHRLSAFEKVIAEPTFYYESYGVGMIYNDEGQEIRSISGKESLKNVTSHVCGKICKEIDATCGCCDSFSYNEAQDNGTCYLKHKQNITNEIVEDLQFGWQTFRSWGESDSKRMYEGDLPQNAEVKLLPPAWYIDDISFTIAFATNGPSQVATERTESINTSSGDDYLLGLSTLQCGEECYRQFPFCNGFSFKPEGGECYLKQINFFDFPNTTVSSDGFQTYWMVETEDIQQTCFCPCYSDTTCVLCNERDNFCREY
eukprot:TRINITY_DN59443_c0_g1_i4.p1 TRINITY_DN59443_c0_g1~~TRINITY_DN59443_c0_g1_i4.p1  ORF type:complete len:293 (+),score=20.58 TRINITY_DN59443_c0_g1_i4:1-879(+)